MAPRPVASPLTSTSRTSRTVPQFAQLAPGAMATGAEPGGGTSPAGSIGCAAVGGGMPETGVPGGAASIAWACAGWVYEGPDAGLAALPDAFGAVSGKAAAVSFTLEWDSGIHPIRVAMPTPLNRMTEMAAMVLSGRTGTDMD